MKRTARTLTLLLLLLFIGATAFFAQSPAKYGSQRSLMGIEVHFRWDDSRLDLGYMNNAASLNRLEDVINLIGPHRIDSLIIVSQSSPEGKYDHNIRLSQRRAATMRRVINLRHPELTDRLHVNPDGESWMQLREYVKHDTLMGQSAIDEVLQVIDSDTDIVTKKRLMTQLSTYDYLLETYYPRIRNSAFCIIYFEAPIDKPISLAEASQLTVELPHTLSPRPIQHFQPQAIEDTPLLIKTNLLYDAALSPNIELEYRVAPHWSVVADYSIAWWKQTDIHWYYQLMQFNPEVRYWFGTDSSWRGHYVGLFVGAGYYDLENGARGYKGEHILSGVSYGYMFPIGKRWSLDAGIGVGAMVTEYEEYLPMDGCYVYQQTSRTRYFGPLKLRLALTWRVDRWKLEKLGQWLKGGRQ